MVQLNMEMTVLIGHGLQILKYRLMAKYRFGPHATYDVA